LAPHQPQKDRKTLNGISHLAFAFGALTAAADLSFPLALAGLSNVRSPNFGQDVRTHLTNNYNQRLQRTGLTLPLRIK
jgi:hypothetical protein